MLLQHLQDGRATCAGPPVLCAGRPVPAASGLRTAESVGVRPQTWRSCTAECYGPVHVHVLPCCWH